VLQSADKNPNVAGCTELVAPAPLRPLSELVEAIRKGEYRYVIGLGAEVDIDQLAAKVELPQLKGFVVFASHEGPLARAAHVALPVCCWAETAGSYVNRHGLCQKTEAVLRPRGDARPAWELIARLARALGYAMDWSSPRDVERALAARSPTDAPAVHPSAEAQP
jgi:NADH-quinone oxidoreductase subunit G